MAQVESLQLQRLLSQPLRPKQGVYAARLNPATGQLSPLGLVAELQRATWLVAHPTLPVVYAVAHSAGGMAADSDIYSFAIDKTSGGLHQINVVDAGGRDADAPSARPCVQDTFLAPTMAAAMSPRCRCCAMAVWARVASAQKDFGSGPHPRQKAAIAHGVTVDPSHQWVLVADFGADRVFVYHFDRKTRRLTRPRRPSKPYPGLGSAPPRISTQRQDLYFNNELSGEIRSYHWDSRSGKLTPQQSLSPYPADYSGEKSARRNRLIPGRPFPVSVATRRPGLCSRIRD